MKKIFFTTILLVASTYGALVSTPPGVQVSGSPATNEVLFYVDGFLQGGEIYGTNLAISIEQNATNSLFQTRFNSEVTTNTAVQTQFTEQGVTNTAVQTQFVSQGVTNTDIAARTTAIETDYLDMTDTNDIVYVASITFTNGVVLGCDGTNVVFVYP